jgi:methyltransferase (TIGR00027 family)
LIDTRESVTAKICSFIRAYHSNYRKQKIFDDYLAYDMMGKEEYEEIKQMLEHELDAYGLIPNTDTSGRYVYSLLDQYVAPIPLSRIAYAELELKHFSEKHGKCQYVICGAGMDTFAFRNVNPDIQIFELDHPDTQRYKLEKIRQLEWNIPDNVHYVAIDFSCDDLASVLTDAGFDLDIPAFFSILGVAYYLTLSVFEQTIKKISDLTKSGSKIVFDYPDETTFKSDVPIRVRLLTEITAKFGEPMEQGFSFVNIKAALERHGFIIEAHLGPEKIQSAFFDGREDGQRAFENVHFISAITADGLL